MSIPATLPNNSFLLSCQNDLSPTKVSAFELQSKVWHVASWVTYVAYIALAVGFFIAANVLFPIYVPIVAISTLIGVVPVASFAGNCVSYSENADHQAKKYRTIQDTAKLISKEDSLETLRDLIKRGIFTIPGYQISDKKSLNGLTPLIAQARYLDTVVKNHLEDQIRFTNDAKKLADTNFDANHETIFQLRNQALYSEQLAMNAKIQAAFVNAVLRKPDFNGSLETIATLPSFNYIERIFGNAFNYNDETNKFLSFNNRNLTSISFNDVKRMEVGALGARIHAAMV